jgi:hypothetical protein
MARGFFTSSGFFAPPSAPPAAYLALVAIFGGDEAAADAWLDDWIAYAGDGATSVDLLAALEAVGVPADALATLRASPVRRADDFTAELDQPAELAFAAPAVPLAEMPGRATDLT